MTLMPALLGGLAKTIGRWVLVALVSAINTLIAAVGAFLQFILSLLPNLPDVPGPPSGADGILGTFAWLFPVGGMLAVLGICVTIWVSFLVIRIGLKWVKGV